MTQAQRYAAIKKAMKDYTKEHTKTREAARAALIREGIYDKNGRIKSQFNEELDLLDSAA